MRRWLKLSFFLIVSALLTLAAAGEYLSYPAHRDIGPPPAELHAQAVRIPSSSTEYVVGWLVPGKPNAGVVLLLHGVRGDRRNMLDRARFLNGHGFGVLLIDLPAHGESSGEHITFGVREAVGVRVALAFLAKQFPNERIGVIGTSLGAASLVLSKPNPAPSAVILESMFPTIEEAVSDRLRRYLGAPATVMMPLLVQQFPLRFGFPVSDLHPIDDMAALHSPTLIMAGSADRNTTLDETRRIFAATQEPKELWIIDDAAHVDLHVFTPKAYEERVLTFLDKYLRQPAI